MIAALFFATYVSLVTVIVRIAGAGHRPDIASPPDVAIAAPNPNPPMTIEQLHRDTMTIVARCYADQRKFR